jgi:hypothetical protein
MWNLPVNVQDKFDVWFKEYGHLTVIVQQPFLNSKGKTVNNKRGEPFCFSRVKIPNVISHNGEPSNPFFLAYVKWIGDFKLLPQEEQQKQQEQQQQQAESSEYDETKKQSQDSESKKEEEDVNQSQDSENKKEEEKEDVNQVWRQYVSHQHHQKYAQLEAVFVEEELHAHPGIIRTDCLNFEHVDRENEKSCVREVTSSRSYINITGNHIVMYNSKTKMKWYFQAHVKENAAWVCLAILMGLYPVPCELHHFSQECSIECKNSFIALPPCGHERSCNDALCKILVPDCLTAWMTRKPYHHKSNMSRIHSFQGPYEFESLDNYQFNDAWR